MDIVLCKWNHKVLEQLKAAGHRVVLVLDQWDASTKGMDKSLADLAIEIGSFNSIEDICALASSLEKSHFKIAEVISHVEFSQYGAGLLAELLGIKGSLSRAMCSRDKRLMKERVNAQGVRSARFFSLPSEMTEAAYAEIQEKIGYPLVLKPANGIGTVMTYRIQSQDELANRLKEIGKASQHPMLYSDQMMVEEFIDGEEYHLDAVWKNGQAVHFGIHKYFAPRLTVQMGAGLDQDGSLFLPESKYGELYKKCREIHKNINIGLDIHNGVTHLEFFVHRKTGEVIFSELATRIAGGAIDLSTQAAYGASLYDIWSRQMVSLDPLPETKPKSDKHVAWLNVGPQKSGTITAMMSEAELRALPGVVDVEIVRGVGEEIDKSHPSCWCILCVFEADSQDELLDLASGLVQKKLFEVQEVTA